MQTKINRVVLIGTGAVGCSYAYYMISQGVAEEMVLIDVNKAKAEGEAMDMNHGIAFAGAPMKILAGDYADCRDADIVVIAAGVPQKDENESRQVLLGRNIAVIKGIVGEVVKSGFSGIFLVASNPVDILAYAVWKESRFPKERVIGSGTTLDTARFRFLLGEYFEVDPRNVHAAIIGEHGDSEFPVWSQASIGIESLSKVLERRENPEDKKRLDEIFEGVRSAAYEIIKRKGATFYGIGMCLTRITRAILNNENSILNLSVLMTGEYGLEDVYISVPALVNRSGIRQVIEIELNETECKSLKKSAAILKEMISQVYGD